MKSPIRPSSCSSTPFAQRSCPLLAGLWPLLALALAGELDPMQILRAADLRPFTVAVFDFESKEDAGRDLGTKIANLLNAYLSADPQVITVERAELAKVLGEQELGLSGTVSTESAAKVGHLTGAQVLVTGRAFRADKELIVVAKIIGTETSRVYGELIKGAAAEPAVSDLAEGLARKISKVLAERGETLIAKVETREARLVRMLKSLKEGKRPSVTVKIAERHFGGPVIDPAAETELLGILQKAGFKTLDEKSAEKPELEITGEAFSAYGVRKGNLISCKARVEIKVRETGTGTLLVAERQTSVAVDIAEQTSAKSALQDATTELAERLVPRLLR